MAAPLFAAQYETTGLVTNWAFEMAAPSGLKPAGWTRTTMKIGGSAKLQNAALDASNWGVHFEADLKDKSGSMVHVVADGKIEDVTNARRWIVGTWPQGSVKGDFKVTRDN